MTSIRSVTGSDWAVKRSAPPTGLVVAVERGRLGAAGEVEVGPRVVVAVERRHAAAHEEGELPVVAVLDAGGRRLLHEARRIERGWGVAPPERHNPNAVPRATAATSTPGRGSRDHQAALPEGLQRARRHRLARREELLDDAQVGDRVPRIDRRRPAVEDRRRKLLGLDGVRVRRREGEHLALGRDRRVASGEDRDLGRPVGRDVERDADRDPPLGPVDVDLLVILGARRAG